MLIFADASRRTVAILLIAGTCIAGFVVWIAATSPRSVAPATACETQLSAARTSVDEPLRAQETDLVMPTADDESATRAEGRVERVPTAPRVKTRPIRTDVPKLLENIESRQESIRRWLVMLDADQEEPDAITPFRIARSISSLSVLTILDAEGRSEYIGATMEEVMALPTNRRGLPLGAISSGGARYVVPPDEFPEYHDIRGRSGSSTLDPKLLQQIRERAQAALSFGY